MLRYTINKDRAKVSVKTLSTGSEIYEMSKGLRIYCPDHKFRVGDNVYFNREDGDATFHEYRSIIEIIDKDNFLVGKFEDIELSVIGVESVEMAYQFGSSDKREYMKIYLNAPHSTIDNRTTIPDYNKHEDSWTYIQEFVTPPNSEDEVAGRCPGDYLLFDEWLLFQADSVDGAGKYVVDNPMGNLNIKDRDIHVVLPEDIAGLITPPKPGEPEEGEEGEEEEPATWEMHGNKITIHGCMIPVEHDGKDDRRTVICPMIEELYSILHEKSQYLGFYATDDRFIDAIDEDPEEGLIYALKRGASIQVRDYCIQLSNLFEVDYNPSLLKEETVKTYIKEAATGGASEIIDYEKKSFMPMADSGIAEMVQFNLHFRDRGGLNGNAEWKTDDSKNWNAWKYPSSLYTEKGGDMLAFLGFVDDDVHYRKKKISKSFLRLSFYDTKNRASQNLLFTATVFFDEGALYGKYIDAVNNGIDSGGSGTAVIGNEKSGIRAEFFCYDKYRNEESSEGYYLHLFPSLIETNGGKVYMKAEFNHAKYGYTIPMTLPRGVEGPPRSNYVKGGEGARYVDMDGLFNDMYAEIAISRTDDGEYIWKPTGNGVVVREGKIIFNLFEPKIN